MQETTRFEIEPVNSKGNLANINLDSVEVIASRKNPETDELVAIDAEKDLALHIEKQADGKFIVKYTPDCEGDLFWDVKIRDNKILKNPMKVSIEKRRDGIDVSGTIAEGLSTMHALLLHSLFPFRLLIYSIIRLIYFSSISSKFSVSVNTCRTL